MAQGLGRGEMRGKAEAVNRLISDRRRTWSTKTETGDEGKAEGLLNGKVAWGQVWGPQMCNGPASQGKMDRYCWMNVELFTCQLYLKIKWLKKKKDYQLSPKVLEMATFCLKIATAIA